MRNALSIVLFIVALGIGLGAAWGNSTPQAKADSGTPAAANNQQTPAPSAPTLSGEQQLELAKLKMQMEAAADERAEKAAAAQAEREFKLATLKAENEQKLATIKAETEKANALAGLKAMNEEEAPAPLAPAPDPRVAALEARLAAMEAAKQTAPTTTASMTTIVPPGYVVLDGKLVRQDSLTNPIHCTPQACGTPATPAPMARQPAQRPSVNVNLVFAPQEVRSGNYFPLRTSAVPRARYCPPPPEPRMCPPSRMPFRGGYRGR